MLYTVNRTIVACAVCICYTDTCTAMALALDYTKCNCTQGWAEVMVLQAIAIYLYKL